MDRMSNPKTENIPKNENIKKDLQKIISEYISGTVENVEAAAVRTALHELSETFEIVGATRTEGKPDDTSTQPKPVSKPLRVSYSQINSYMTCPMQYKFRYVFNILAPKTAPPIFGQVIHKTLQHFYLKVINGEKTDKNTLLELYENFWESGCFVDPTEEMKYKQKGERQLAGFYEKNKDTLRPPLYVEKDFLLQVGVITITGKIDRIDDLGSKKVGIIDYKTGAAKTQKDADKDMQMSIYAAAAKSILPGKEIDSLTFYYLETNEKVSTARTEEQVEETFSHIREIAGEISALKFDPVEGYHCNWCAYPWICPAKQPAK